MKTKVECIIEGLYGISESEKMMPNKTAREILNDTIKCLEKALVEQEIIIRAKAINDFADRVISEYHQLPTTLGYTEEIIRGIAEKLKGGAG